MIRPITVMCWVLALSAGLYLYRAKHEVELMDQHIDQIAKQTADLRSQSRRLLDDWIRLGEPEQLHKYSDEYLGLKTIAPSQFARLSDLPGRLPATEPTPPADQPDVVGQSPDSPAPDATTADTVATAVPPSAAGPATIESATGSAPAGGAAADTDNMDEATAGDLPVPPIPPAIPPVTAISFPAVTAPPLQARPVTPRAATVQQDPDPERTRPSAPARIAEEPRTAPAKTAPAEPRQAAAPTVAPAPNAAVLSAQEPGASVPASNKPAWQSHGLPPLQAQGSRTTQGLPPSLSRGPAPGMAQEQGSGPTPGQASVAPAYRAAEPRVAEAHGNEPRRDERPMPPRPAQISQYPQMPAQVAPAQGAAMERGPVAQIARQAPIPAAGPGGSLLGMSRGPVPLPLPAPTPVNATWNPSGASSGPGR